MARIKPPHRRRILLELDLTEIPVELDQDDPLARLRHRGRHDLRSTLRALHEAADDPRVVGLIARICAKGVRAPYFARNKSFSMWPLWSTALRSSDKRAPLWLRAMPSRLPHLASAARSARRAARGGR